MNKAQTRPTRHAVEVGLMEFDEGGNTIWIQAEGGTVLRIKCTGKIIVHNGCENTLPHADVNVAGNINICVP